MTKRPHTEAFPSTGVNRSALKDLIAAAAHCASLKTLGALPEIRNSRSETDIGSAALPKALQKNVSLNDLKLHGNSGGSLSNINKTISKQSATAA
jgi:hypothetical protein